jgi:SAM-dependent methyltransferase
MKIENKEYWEKDAIVATFDKEKTTAGDYEIFMFSQAKERQKEIRNVENIKIFGCGAGREVNEAAKYFHPKKMVASENMIAKCNYNLKVWGIDNITETILGSAKDIQLENDFFDLVVIFDSMLTYVAKRSERLEIFIKSFSILKSNGVIIGTVHNQEGILSKTIYFKIRNWFSFLLGEKVGNRNTGSRGFKVAGYYYNKNGLIKDIHEADLQILKFIHSPNFMPNKI